MAIVKTLNQSYDDAALIAVAGTYVWDSGSLSWVKAVQAGVGGGGSLTDAELRASPVPVSGPLTDAQIRATPLPVSGTVSVGTVPVTGTFWQATQPVSGPLTDAQLRAVAVPVSGTVAVTGTTFDGIIRDGTGDTTQANVSSGRLHVDGSGVTQPVSGTFFQATQPVSVASTLATDPIDDPTRDMGKIDVASLDQYTPVSGRLPVDGSGVTQPVSGTFFQATQPVSIAATVQVDVTDEPARDMGKIDVASLDQYTPVSGRLPVDGSGVTQPVSGPLTDAQLRATAVPISGTVTSNQGTAGSTDWRIDLRRGQTVLFGVINTAASGFVTLVAADVTRKIKVLHYALVVAGTTNVYFASASTQLTGAMPFIANTGIASPVSSPAAGHLLETAVNEAFRLNNSSAVQVSGHFSYFLET
jgi:hypothetical protein